MKKEKEEKRLGLLITHKISNVFGEPHLEITAQIVKIEEENKVRNLSSGEMFRNIYFEERNYIDKFGEEAKVMNYIDIYHAGTYIDTFKDIELAYKSMKSLKEKYEKIEKQEGPVLDFAQYLVRMSKILGAKDWIWIVGKDTGWHNQNEYKFTDLYDGVYKLRQIKFNDEWVEILKKTQYKNSIEKEGIPC